MYNICPVCEGSKKLKYYANYYYGKRLVETKCWACRGSGYVNYQKPVEITETDIKTMYNTLVTA